MIKSGTICRFSKLSAHNPRMKPNRLKLTDQENHHPGRVRDMDRHEYSGSGKNDAAGK
jgi:hypothetical protein